MIRSRQSTALAPEARLLSSVLALLFMVCAALPSGLSKPAIATGGFWYDNLRKAPLIDVIGYPRDGLRNGRLTNEDTDHLDPPGALSSYPYALPAISAAGMVAGVMPSVRTALSGHRSQAPRAPPLA